MNIQLGRSKEILVKTIYEASKAFQYWSLNEPNIGRIIDLNVDSLKSNFLGLISSQLAAKAAQGRNPQTVNIPIISLDSVKQDFTKVWDEITKTLQIRFSITPDIEPFISHPEWKRLLVSNIKVQINSVSLNNLSINVIHSGFVKIIDSKVVTFSHIPRITNISFDATGNQVTGLEERNLGGDNINFVDLSPFTQWVLIVHNGTIIDHNLINTIEIEFDGTFFAG